MALGDTGITPLQHTGAYADFANGGKLAKPYAILEMFNSKGELIYSPRARRAEAAAGREPQGRRGHEPDDAGGRARTAPASARSLDFTAVAGKTGTSSSYRDAWFVGFTGALVTGRVGRLRRLPADGRHHRRQPAGAGLAQPTCRSRTELPHHSADPGPRPRIPTRWPSSSGSPSSSAPTRPGPGADRAGHAEDDEHHARPDAGRAEEAGGRPCGRPPACSRRRPAPRRRRARAAAPQGAARRPSRRRSLPSARRSGAPRCPAPVERQRP